MHAPQKQKYVCRGPLPSAAPTLTPLVRCGQAIAAKQMLSSFVYGLRVQKLAVELACGISLTDVRRLFSMCAQPAVARGL